MHKTFLELYNKKALKRSTSVDKENASTLFCSKAQETFCGL